MAQDAGLRTRPGGLRRLPWVLGISVAVVVAGIATYEVVRLGSAGGPSANPMQPADREVDLLPSVGTKSACLVGTPGVPRPTLPLANGTLQANTYSVPSGTEGHIGMCYDSASGSLFSYANWSVVGAGGGWFSYPQVAYGVNDYAGESTTYTNQSPAWQLPQTVAATVNRSLWVSASYEIVAPSSSDVDGWDVSFDDFLSATLPPSLEVPPFVEVEIFLAHNISYPFRWAQWSTPTLVNSTVAIEPWDVAYYCHGVDNGTNGNISFDFSYGGQTTHGLERGTLGVNLSAIFQLVEEMMPSASCWTGPANGFSAFHLGEEDLGSEDGARAGADFNYNWTVERYCLHPGVVAESPGVLGCGAPSSTGFSDLRSSHTVLSGPCCFEAREAWRDNSAARSSAKSLRLPSIAPVRDPAGRPILK